MILWKGEVEEVDEVDEVDEVEEEEEKQKKKDKLTSAHHQSRSVGNNLNRADETDASSCYPD